MIESIYTIGVYGSTEASFFQTLVDAQIDLFCDIRQRRGLRGKRYAYANSSYLQNRLEELGIAYLHEKALAPTSAIRQKQYDVDKQTKTGKRQRETLDTAFVETYQQEILQPFDLKQFIQKLQGYRRVCFFCVERLPEACHRSIVVIELKEIVNVGVTHLMP